MSVCKTLLPDVTVAEVHQQTVPCITMIAAMYVSSADLLLIHYARISMVGGYTENLKNPQNWGGGRLRGDGR